ncbi:MAG TPA: C13 family peptidase [Vicinamibacteria bacterium]|nr:C13 family peptidase [Vicinamibacteria bacterium]
MKRAARRALMLVIVLAAWAVPAGAEQSHLLIVVGLGGEPKYTDAFHELALKMIQAAEKKMGVAASNITYLGEKAADPAVPVYKGRSSRENVQKALGTLAQTAGPGDLVFILLIGHGGAQGGESRFNLPGPDMTAADFAPLLAALSGRQVVFVNTASASGDFVKALSAKGRTIVTATKSAMERNQTEFPSYFVQAFSEDGADADKDQRVSVLEAFTYARREVERFYEKGHLLLTEHAILDDNGDGVGSAVPDPAVGDGRVARTLFLGGGNENAADDAASGTADPRVADLRRQRRALEQEIAALKVRKDAMPPAEYEEELEKLLVELARRDAALRQREGAR